MATLLNFGFTKPSASKPSNETVDANQDENNNDSGPVQAGSKTMAAKRCFTACWLKKYSWLIYDEESNAMKCKFFKFRKGRIHLGLMVPKISKDLP